MLPTQTFGALANDETERFRRETAELTGDVPAVEEISDQ